MDTLERIHSLRSKQLKLQKNMELMVRAKNVGRRTRKIDSDNYHNLYNKVNIDGCKLRGPRGIKKEAP